MSTTKLYVAGSAAELRPGRVITVAADGDAVLAWVNPRAVSMVDYPVGTMAPDSAYDLLRGEEFVLTTVEPAGPTDAEDGIYYCDAGFTVNGTTAWDAFLGPNAAQLRETITGVRELEDDQDSDRFARYADTNDLHLDEIHKAHTAAEYALQAIGADKYWWGHQASCVAGNELIALAARDLIGTTTDWTRERYELLTLAWRTHIGSLHPEDPR